jgi:Immunity protein 32
MLSIVTDKDGDVVYMHADKSGLEKMQRVVARLLKHLEDDDCEHDHLFSESWAGDELSETMLDQERQTGCKQVSHLKVYGWTDEWAVKHGLKASAA